MNNGWIKLHRKFLEWEWYDDLKTKHLFLHLLIMANYKTKEWRGIMIKRGEFLTGRKKLAKQTGLSEQNIRTSLDKLKSTNEITIKSTSKYSIITLIKYDEYQDVDKEVTSKTSSKEPTTNQQSTTTKKDKNVKKEKKYIAEERLAKLFFQLIQDNTPTAKEPNYNTWAKQINDLIRLDKRTMEQVEFLIRWAQEDQFWKSNIMSPIKLRKHFDVLVAKLKSNSADKYISI